MDKILVTGSSGFIGMQLCKSLLKDGFDVLGLDNMCNYYSISLKSDRLKVLEKYENFNFINADITDYKKINQIIKNFNPSTIVNFAGEAGVRYSIQNPQAFINSNILGFVNILECAKVNNIQNFIYASSSSVYGVSNSTPFSINDEVNKPISVYAASKRSNELIAYTYSHLFGINTIGFRFFTVYGPWGRPDMAIYIFTEKILNDLPIDVFNYGEYERDFTYIEDIVSGIRLSLNKNFGYEIFNLGNSSSINLLELISIIEKKLGKKAEINLLGPQEGDPLKTYADIRHSKKVLGYSPRTSIKKGVSKFINWYLRYC